jgi:hypothetical protein
MVNKKKSLIVLPESVVLKNWDVAKGYPKGSREQVKKLIAYLEDVRLNLGNCHKELLAKGRLVTTNAIKNLYLGEADESFTLSRPKPTTMKPRPKN